MGLVGLRAKEPLFFHPEQCEAPLQSWLNVLSQLNFLQIERQINYLSALATPALSLSSCAALSRPATVPDHSW